MVRIAAPVPNDTVLAELFGRSSREWQNVSLVNAVVSAVVGNPPAIGADHGDLVLRGAETCQVPFLPGSEIPRHYVHLVVSHGYPSYARSVGRNSRTYIGRKIGCQ